MRPPSPRYPAGCALLLALAGSCAPALAVGCAPPPKAAASRSPAAASAPGDPAEPRGAPREALAWAPFAPATFARARAEHKLVVLDGAAEWCHWCHVMEATTYHDPAVRELLAAHFIATKVDVDARPDIEERYGDYGWPATVLFSADGQELGKYRGYIAPEAFAEILRAVVEAPVGAKATPSTPGRSAAKGLLTEDEIALIERFTELDLQEFYDETNGGWGRWQKAAVSMDDAFSLLRARGGDEKAKAQVLFTLDKQRALLDPVWGGIYQYSAAPDWEHPHFEKLMTFQAGALESYAEAYALTRDPKWLAIARSVRGYVDRFLTSPEGGFYATQDADLNAHEPGKRYLTGHEYYPLDDAHRRALGIPRVDTHEYGTENALAIAAYVTLYQASGDGTALAAAERAAKRVLATHATASGGVIHDAREQGEPGKDAATRGGELHLSDNAQLGLALMRLHEATKKPEYADAALRIGEVLLRDLADPEGGGFFASDADPDAVGVFAVRRKPFDENVVAVRFLARLARMKPDDARLPAAIGNALHAIATPDAIKGRGRMLGDFLLALEETRGVRGAAATK